MRSLRKASSRFGPTSVICLKGPPSSVMPASYSGALDGASSDAPSYCEIGWCFRCGVSKQSRAMAMHIPQIQSLKPISEMKQSEIETVASPTDLSNLSHLAPRLLRYSGLKAGDIVCKKLSELPWVESTNPRAENAGRHQLGQKTTIVN